jgi:hypothetical protein
MALAPGTKLGPYEIVSPLGAGGMGEVYRAHDSRLGRDVAIKVLPREFVVDPDRLARFRREARLLASLNHPNIATIHGLEDSGGSAPGRSRLRRLYGFAARSLRRLERRIRGESRTETSNPPTSRLRPKDG